MASQVKYKIRNTVSGQFSHGVVLHLANQPYIKWSSKGKEWNSEKAVKNHLVKAIESNISMANWEIVQLVYTLTKPIEDWVDAKMLVKILKK